MSKNTNSAGVSIKFLGAAGTVTGSRTLLTVGEENYLIDCGLFQGDKTLRSRNWSDLDLQIGSINAVLLTHAHLDHSGYLPRLSQMGLKAPILCSGGTADLCRVLLMDAAYLEEESAHFANRSGYSHHKPALPLFTREDAERALGLIQEQPRETWVVLSESVSVRFLRAGHIIGASMIQVAVSVAGSTKYITFSGDVGHDRSHVMRGPVTLPQSDVLVLESTYGDRLHSRADVLSNLAEIINKTYERGGVVVIPSFAVGRAQEVLYLIRELEDAQSIPQMTVILDSPMAVTATEILMNHLEDTKLSETGSGRKKDFLPNKFMATHSADESMLACMRDGPFIVLSAAGMLSGGRILHHLKARLPDSKNTVLFTGYQAEGTKGRFLQDNAASTKTLRIHHQEVMIAAEVLTLESLSAHGDYQDILDWLGKSEPLPGKIFINHGSTTSMKGLAEKIKKIWSIDVEPVTVEKSYSIF